jgi:hypothetical protein
VDKFRKINDPWSVTQDEKPLPRTYEEAVEYVAANMEPVNPASEWFAGQAIRNGLGLWQKDNPLYQDMLNRFGLCMADDTGMIISNAAKALKNNEPYTPDEDIQMIREHWAKAGIDPRTMEKIR